jgi:hypothetical protein
VTIPATEYVRPVHRIAIRWRTKAGVWEDAVVISTLLPQTVLVESGRSVSDVVDHHTATVAYVRFSDDRGGGVETAIKDDKQGLGLTKRNKKRFEAQQMVVLLGMLAHTVIVWARRWLAAHDPKLQLSGHKRMVRDVFPISGRLIHTARGRLVTIVLNQAAPRARAVARSLELLLRPMHSDVHWGEI